MKNFAQFFSKSRKLSYDTVPNVTGSQKLRKNKYSIHCQMSTELRLSFVNVKNANQDHPNVLSEKFKYDSILY